METEAADRRARPALSAAAGHDGSSWSAARPWRPCIRDTSPSLDRPPPAREQIHLTPGPTRLPRIRRTAPAVLPGNRLIAALDDRTRALVAPDLEPVPLARGAVLFHPGDDVAQVHFPLGSAVISLLAVLADGRAAEVATIGREGAVGGIVSGGHKPAFCRAVVQIAGQALRLPAARLQAAKDGAPAMRDLFARYADCLLAQVQQSVVCNAAHALEARLCRWLLATLDRVGGPDIPLTQDALAEMLGSQRSTVTPVAGELRRRGLIAYRRGEVRVLDRAGLEAASCECHAAVRRHFDSLLPGLYPGSTARDGAGAP